MDMVPLFIVRAALDKGHIKGTVFVPDLFETIEIPGITAEIYIMMGSLNYPRCPKSLVPVGKTPA